MEFNCKGDESNPHMTHVDLMQSATGYTYEGTDYLQRVIKMKLIRLLMKSDNGWVPMDDWNCQRWMLNMWFSQPQNSTDHLPIEAGPIEIGDMPMDDDQYILL